MTATLASIRPATVAATINGSATRTWRPEWAASEQAPASGPAWGEMKMSTLYDRTVSTRSGGKRMLRAALVASVSAVATGSLAVPALAQDAPAAEEENTIIVTGVRGALERAMAIQRDASGVVDAISAEDIGKFPDTNLAESLQRVPGVSINRVNGEGSQVTVRGFGPQ